MTMINASLVWTAPTWGLLFLRSEFKLIFTQILVRNRISRCHQVIKMLKLSIINRLLNNTRILSKPILSDMSPLRMLKTTLVSQVSIPKTNSNAILNSNAIRAKWRNNSSTWCKLPPSRNVNHLQWRSLKTTQIKQTILDLSFQTSQLKVLWKPQKWTLFQLEIGLPTNNQLGRLLIANA